VLKKLLAWLEERREQVPASIVLGRAIGYMLGQWVKLVRYLDGQLLGPDNNACERATDRLSSDRTG
jgi:transposase